MVIALSARVKKREYRERVPVCAWWALGGVGGGVVG